MLLSNRFSSGARCCAQARLPALPITGFWVPRRNVNLTEMTALTNSAVFCKNQSHKNGRVSLNSKLMRGEESRFKLDSGVTRNIPAERVSHASSCGEGLLHCKHRPPHTLFERLDISYLFPCSGKYTPYKAYRR
jgi:hypothetical protein